MDTKDASTFGMRESFQLLGLMFLSSISLLFILLAILDAANPGLDSIELRVITRSIASLANPLLWIFLSFLVLKHSFPDTTSRDLLLYFGFNRQIPKWQLVFSFAIGVLLILSVKVLRLEFVSSSSELAASTLSRPLRVMQLVWAINAITLVPIGEEFVFRGVLYKGFANSSNKLLAALLVSILFAMAHIGDITIGDRLTLLTQLVAPIVLIAAREITASLYSPILIHSGFNFGSIFLTVE